MLSEIASNLGYDEEVVRAVVAEFALQLHRHAFEYRSGNGDFIGEELWSLVDRQTFYHLLGFLTYFAERYGWDDNSASNYLLRLGCQAVWAPFQHQMAGWQSARPRQQE